MNFFILKKIKRFDKKNYQQINLKRKDSQLKKIHFNVD